MSEALQLTPTEWAEPVHKAEFRYVSPQEAADVLEHRNPRNRSVRVKVADRYMNSILGMTWMVTGQPIIFDWNGDLLDGQHRLMACRDSGVAIYTLVVTGIDPEVMPAIDKNTPRSTRDTFRWAGKHNPVDYAPIARPLWGLSQGIFMGNSERLHRIDDQQLMELIEPFEDSIVTAIPLASRMYKSRGLSKRNWGVALAWIIHNGADKALVEDFVTSVVIGADLSIDDPRYQFRNWCDRARGLGGPKRKLRSDEHVIAVVKAWNYWVTGKTIKQFAVKPTETLPAVEVGA